jgi:hypothetical protein
MFVTGAGVAMRDSELCLLSELAGVASKDSELCFYRRWSGQQRFSILFILTRSKFSFTY